MNTIAQTLTWTLIHSLWLSVLVWVILKLIDVFVSASAKRKWLKLGAIVAFSLGIFSLLIYEASLQYNHSSTLWVTQGFILFDHELNRWEQFKNLIDQYSIWIFSTWLIGTLVGALKLFNHQSMLKKFRAASHPLDYKEINELVERLCGQMNIKRKVQVLINGLINSPMTTGFIKPVIYLPFGLLSGLSQSELESILRHELAHIKGNDYLIVLFLSCLETIFFFNPILSVLIRDLKREMEYTCDDEVINHQHQLIYTRALLKCQEFRLKNKLALNVRNNNSEFKNRIERMINSNNKPTNPRVALVTLMLLLAMISTAFVGKNNSSPTTESLTESEVLAPAILQNGKDTLRFKTTEELKAKLKEIGFKDAANHVYMVNGKPIRVIIPVDNALDKADEMMKEIQKELVADGLLSEERPKMTLMFQYSDLLNGKVNLGDQYEKYKAIFNRYFPKYDSYACTRVFRYKQE